jgi:hypothetical protein
MPVFITTAFWDIQMLQKTTIPQRRNAAEKIRIKYESEKTRKGRIEKNKTTQKTGKENVVRNPIIGNHFFLYF